MNIKEMREVLDTITYRPGSRLQLDADFNGDSLRLRVVLLVLDAVDLSTKTLFQQVEAVPLRATTERKLFIDFVFETVLKAETHEVQEFFRVGDSHWIEPHPDDPLAWRRDEQDRYLVHKKTREMAANSAKEISQAPKLYGFQSDAETKLYERAKQAYRDFMDNMDNAPVFEKGWFIPNLVKKKKPTTAGLEKKEKRARSAHKKGFSNKPWDALR